MEKTVLEFVKNKTNDILNSHTTCKELRDEANRWLASIGTSQEPKETKAYIAELEEDLLTIDELIDFIDSDRGKNILGKQVADVMLKHSLERKKAGAKYCDCPACQAVASILEKKEEMLE